MPIIDVFKKKKPKPKTQKKVQSVKSKTTEAPLAKPKKKVFGKAYKVLIKPLVTEKASWLSSQGKYVFKVALDATKKDIKQAIQEVYKVKPIAVHTIKILGKKRRYKRTVGQTSTWKKAIVTLRPGEKIEIVEGV